MPGTAIFQAEVTNVSPHGFWLLVSDEEFFLPFADFPWFRSASIDQLCDVQMLTDDHLFWQSLDLDLTLTSLRDPAAFPLIASMKAHDLSPLVCS